MPFQAIAGHYNNLYGIKDLNYVKFGKNWRIFWDIILEIYKNFRKYGKRLEKIEKSLGEIPVSASDYMNFSRDIHYFSRMQHPLIWKNIYPCIMILNQNSVNIHQ